MQPIGYDPFAALSDSVPARDILVPIVPKEMSSVKPSCARKTRRVRSKTTADQLHTDDTGSDMSGTHDTLDRRKTLEGKARASSTFSSWIASKTRLSSAKREPEAFENPPESHTQTSSPENSTPAENDASVHSSARSSRASSVISSDIDDDVDGDESDSESDSSHAPVSAENNKNFENVPPTSSSQAQPLSSKQPNPSRRQHAASTSSTSSTYSTPAAKKPSYVACCAVHMRTLGPCVFFLSRDVLEDCARNRGLEAGLAFG